MISKKSTHAFSKRLGRLRRKLSHSKADSLLITHLPNVRYLCGFTGSNGALLIDRSKCIFITDSRYREQSSIEVTADESVIYSDGDHIKQVIDLVHSFGHRRLGVEGSSLSCRHYLLLDGGLGHSCRTLVTGGLVESLREVKDDLELRLMKKAAHIADKAFKRVLENIREDMTEIELSHMIRDALEHFGGQKLSFDTIALFGPNSSLIHGQPGKSRLKKGRLILMDFGTVYEGYCSDMTRTVAFGEPGREIRRAYRAVQQAQKQARQAVKAGIRCADVDDAARAHLDSLGYGEEFSHSTGHCLGLEIHENPRLSRNSRSSLRAGAVVTVEPGVYLPGRFGIRIEDMVHVTKEGPELLSHSPRKLLVL